VHDWTLSRGDPVGWRSPAGVPDSQVRGLHSLAQIVRAFHEVYGREEVAFDIVVSGAFDVTGDERLFPEGGSVVGFARVAPQEKLRLTCRLLDLNADQLAPEEADATATQVAQALMSASDRVIALRREYWWRQDFERCPIAPDRTAGPRLKQGGVYLITGGLGHIGMIFARRLARDWNARLILVGRSPLEDLDEPTADDGETPWPERRARLAEINALGGEAIYVQADVSEIENVQRLREIAHETFGGLDGLILGAGTIERPIAADDIEAFDAYRENFSGKFLGFKNALAVFGEDPLDFAVLVSSISTVLGGLGHTAYAGANHMADLLLLQHRRSGHPNWITSNWDLWAGGKVSAADPRVSWMIDKAIRPEEGAQALVDLLSLPQLGQVVIATHDLQARFDTWVRGILEPDVVRTVQHKRPNLAAAYAEAEGELELKLAKLWSQILGIDPIGRDDDFFEMGGHSLLAVRIAVQVQDFMPADAPSANLYETPTIRTLAEALLQRPFAEGAGAAPLEAVS
jgi:NAD(P)-dependent dehydrogenase (short-subunit alcohol dehydrogenase family)